MTKRVLILIAIIIIFQIFVMTELVKTQQPAAIDLRKLRVGAVEEPKTLDPAWATDEASLELIFNIHERLVAFNVSRDKDGYIQNPMTAGRTDEFVSAIAESWIIEGILETDPETGLTWVERWTFKIRNGVLFHDGDMVTPQDVEYTFERWMVQCRNNGPTWRILRPLLGVDYVRPNYPAPNPVTNGKMIDHAVESNQTHVWFNLVQPYNIFLYLLAQPWSSILSYDWCTSIGDWPGEGVAFEDRWGDYTGWVEFNDPVISPIDHAYNQGINPVGAGPYMFDYWSLVEWHIVKFDDYYLGWPAPINPDNPGGGTLPDYIEDVTMKFIEDWPSRYMMFMAGDLDICLAERCISGFPCYEIGKPPLMVSMYNWNISTTSPLLGVPGGLPPGTFAEDGIPPDFFSDIDIRKAIAYCFNFTEYIQEIGIKAIHPNTTIIPGIPYHNPDQPGYYINLTAAEEHFKIAHGGQVWENGFTFGIAYNVGNIRRGVFCEMLKTTIESLNPKFHVEIFEVDWSTYLEMLANDEHTILVYEYCPDIQDPHYYVEPFMHPDTLALYDIQYGRSGHTQIRYYVNGVPYGNPGALIDNEYVGEMIENGIKTTNETEREIIYYELQSIYFDECPNFPLYCSGKIICMWDYVKGWYHNPAYHGLQLYFYHYWKSPPPVQLPVDVRVIIEPILIYDKVQICDGKMMLNGNPVYMLFNITVTRIDVYPEPTCIFVTVGFNRTDYNQGIWKVPPNGYQTVWLTCGQSFYFIFNWTTPPDVMQPGIWNLSAFAYVTSSSAYDENPSDNVMLDGTVKAVELTGDVNCDGVVDIYDAIIFASCFGRYCPECDFNEDGIVDIYDAIQLAANFGRRFCDIDP